MKCIKINKEDFIEEEVISIKKNMKHTFDLEVEDAHHYILENGIVSHNTTSLSVGRNCSSGIEPIFSLQYNRTIKMDEGKDKTESVYDYAWLLYLDHLGVESLDKVPDFFKTTFDISPYDAIEVQGILQKYIDASISKTVNLPNDCTFEEFKDLFQFSWTHKLKGFTSFNPKGSMKGILSTETSEEEAEGSCYNNAPKRPRELPCDIYDMTVNKKRVVALVGLYEGRPYEVFLTDDPDEMITLKGAKQGVIEKIKKGTYQLNIYGKRSKYSLEITSELFDPEMLALGRMVSMTLRHNISLPFVVKQLNKTNQFGTFSKGMARVLRKYFVDVETGEVCPDCGKELKYYDGCKSCSCGWSKCE